MDHLDMITVGPEVSGRGVRLDCTRCVAVGWTAYVQGETVSPARANLARLIAIAEAHVREAHPRPLEWCEVHQVRHMKPGQGEPERDPCAGGRCSDPAAHAEGGHDV